ncbi:hypothetical protein B296_00005178 [Ensete ventricosum]|uniref:Uncharacterized protein n=1 Tax=Ensete ventricosum TaxID=4639 RepID=A0A427ATM1_ENSVE|nr:hypothetical protein B296_00005178 [Ensete ventricosum]
MANLTHPSPSRSTATLAFEVKSRPFQLGGQVGGVVSSRGGGVRTWCHPDSPSTRHECCMAHHILAPHHCTNWPAVQLGHARGDDRGKVERTGDLPSGKIHGADAEQSSRADDRADARALTSEGRSQPESEIPISTYAGELAYSVGTRSG